MQSTAVLLSNFELAVYCDTCVAFFRWLLLTSQVRKGALGWYRERVETIGLPLQGQFTKRTFQHSAFRNDLNGVLQQYFGVGNTITIYTMTWGSLCGSMVARTLCCSSDTYCGMIIMTGFFSRLEYVYDYYCMSGKWSFTLGFKV